MKKILRTISLSGIGIICFFSCGKNNPTPPNPGNNGKLCRVVDYSDNTSSVTAGDVWHLLFQYNDEDQLVRFDQGNKLEHDEITYDAQGHISKINHFQGNLSAPPNFTVVYTGDFVTQVNYIDGNGSSSFSLTLSWNLKGAGELDKVDIPKTTLSSSGYESFVYSANVGLAEYHEGSTEQAHPYDHILEQTIPVNIRPAVANPFFTNTTKDERFLYWFFLNGIGPIGQLSALNGGGWNDNILASNQYDVNGQKSEYLHVKFEFILDSNDHVIKRIAYKAIDAPSFSNYVKFDENTIVYECK